MKRCTLSIAVFFFAGFICPSLTASQSVAPVDKGPVVTKESKLQSIQNIGQWVAGLRDDNMSALTMAQMADVSWSQYEEHARGLFAHSLNKAAILQNDTPKQVTQKITLNKKIVSLIAKRDKAWARTLIDSLSKDESKRSSTNLETAQNLIESDPGAAAEFAGRSMENEYPPLFMNFLNELRRTEPAAADRMFAELISKYPRYATVDANQYSSLGTYIFTGPGIDPNDFGTIVMTRVGNLFMPNITVNRPGVPPGLITNYIRSALQLMQRPSPDPGQAHIKYALGYLLLPKTKVLSPGMHAELVATMAMLSASVPPELTADDAFKYMTPKPPSTPEDRIKEIEKNADSYARDQLFMDMAFHALKKNDFATASFATSKIENEKIQSELETLIAFCEINNLLKAKKVDFETAAKGVDKLPETLEKIMLNLRFATIAADAKNIAIQRERLDLAHGTAKRLNDDHSPFILLYIAAQMKRIKEPYASTVMAEAVKSFNKTPEIKDPVYERRLIMEPLTLRFPLNQKDVNLSFQASFGVAIADNEEEALSMVNDILDERLKAQAYVALTRAYLAKPLTPLPVRQAAN
ncbi:hypothetical protein BH20ACI2_BH20ACI2_10340 [soil metagenome]